MLYLQNNNYLIKYFYTKLRIIKRKLCATKLTNGTYHGNILIT